MKIGQVAKTAGVGIDAVRFYEREGLLAKPSRRLSGYREYSPDVVVHLRFIRRAKELGFTLKEIRELLSLRMDSDTTCSDIRRRAEAKLDDVENKIRDLRRMKKALEELKGACKGRGPASDCPILEYLEKEELK